MDLRLLRQRARDAGDVNDRYLAALRSAERWWLATAASARSQTLARGPTLRRGIEPEPEIRYGSGPVTLLMPFMLGQKKTNELLFTGDVLAADDAERLGLVNAVVARDELESAVQALALKIAPTPLPVLRLTKAALNRAYEAMGLRMAVQSNLDLSAILNAAGTPEQREFDRLVEADGLKAALEWRDSRYGGSLVG